MQRIWDQWIQDVLNPSIAEDRVALKAFHKVLGLPFVADTSDWGSILRYIERWPRPKLSTYRGPYGTEPCSRSQIVGKVVASAASSAVFNDGSNPYGLLPLRSSPLLNVPILLWYWPLDIHPGTQDALYFFCTVILLRCEWDTVWIPYVTILLHLFTWHRRPEPGYVPGLYLHLRHLLALWTMQRIQPRAPLPEPRLVENDAPGVWRAFSGELRSSEHDNGVFTENLDQVIAYARERWDHFPSLQKQVVVPSWAAHSLHLLATQVLRLPTTGRFVHPKQAQHHYFRWMVALYMGKYLPSPYPVFLRHYHRILHQLCSLPIPKKWQEVFAEAAYQRYPTRR